MFGKSKRRIAGLLVFIMVFHITAWFPGGISEVHAASSAPKLNAKITKNNVMKVLNQYDRDGAYILKKQAAVGDNILRWFSGGRIIDNIDAAVHEETHGYHYYYAKGGKMAYFIGKQKTVYVPYTKVYHTKKMAGSIPKNLRTFRYNTYVAKPIANLASNVNGAYGLMNEFMAYRAGMNTAVSMYSYLADKKANWDTWTVFISNCENDRLAYAEFKYYILHYLYYAKKHYPQVYKGIMNNKQFRTAYKRLESSYAGLIRTYEQDLKKLQKLFVKKGCRIEIKNDTVWMYRNGSGRGVSRYTSDYKKLQREINKSRYKSIHSRLVR